MDLPDTDSPWWSQVAAAAAVVLSTGFIWKTIDSVSRALADRAASRRKDREEDRALIPLLMQELRREKKAKQTVEHENRQLHQEKRSQADMIQQLRNELERLRAGT